jgi:hypothetical protein
MIKLKEVSVDAIVNGDGEEIREMLGVSYKELEDAVDELGIKNNASVSSLQKVLDEDLPINIKLWFVITFGTELGIRSVYKKLIGGVFEGLDIQ